MRIKILGPLVAEENSVSLTPSASKPRQVLSLLALNANRVISVATLIEEIWGDNPPRSSATTLQTYIFQLRRKLDAALARERRRTAKDVIVTRHGGYLLLAEPGDVDVHRFERLSSDARAVCRFRSRQPRLDLFTQALSLWNGPRWSTCRSGGSSNRRSCG